MKDTCISSIDTYTLHAIVYLTQHDIRRELSLQKNSHSDTDSKGMLRLAIKKAADVKLSAAMQNAQEQHCYSKRCVYNSLHAMCSEMVQDIEIHFILDVIQDVECYIKSVCIDSPDITFDDEDVDLFVSTQKAITSSEEQHNLIHNTNKIVKYDLVDIAILHTNDLTLARECNTIRLIVGGDICAYRQYSMYKINGNAIGSKKGDIITARYDNKVTSFMILAAYTYKTLTTDAALLEKLGFGKSVANSSACRDYMKIMTLPYVYDYKLKQLFDCLHIQMSDSYNTLRINKDTCAHNIHDIVYFNKNKFIQTFFSCLKDTANFCEYKNSNAKLHSDHFIKFISRYRDDAEDCADVKESKLAKVKEIYLLSHYCFQRSQCRASRSVMTYKTFKSKMKF